MLGVNNFGENNRPFSSRTGVNAGLLYFLRIYIITFLKSGNFYSEDRDHPVCDLVT